jgi:23S rRNA pseudouridine1911/1915/1917 synthase
MKNFHFNVEEKDNKKRLDHFLVERLADDFSRSYVQKLIAQGHVRINATRVKSNTKIKNGDAVELVVPPPKKTEVAAEDISLNIVFEDEHLLVIDKPVGMVVHPAAGHYTGTMVNALLAHCNDLSGIGGELRPGIVHRLDKETSGLLVVAKDDYTHRKLSNQFKQRSIKRKYIAFVRGLVELDNGTINLPIGRHKRHRQKMAVGFTQSREAVTHYRVLKRYDDYTMLELVLGTGRTHQIRTHLEYLGYPLLGDKKYGKNSEKIGRHALHAATLGFKHPVTKEFLEFESELPEDMKRLL